VAREDITYSQHSPQAGDTTKYIDGLLEQVEARPQLNTRRTRELFSASVTPLCRFPSQATGRTTEQQTDKH